MKLKVWLVDNTNQPLIYVVASYRVTDGCLWMVFGEGKSHIIPLHRIFQIEVEANSRVASV